VNRPEALAHCDKYMLEQTFNGVVEWIIVDDSSNQLPANKTLDAGIYVKYFRGPRKWEEGLNTQRFNMEEAIKHVKGKYVFFIEDDDLYKKNYVETMMDLLAYADIVGEAKSKYYNLQLPGYKEMHNYRHASLCQTAMKRSVLPLLKQAIDSGEMYFDIHLWANVQKERIPYALIAESNLVIGIKGMPGREGIGVGHRNKDYLMDPKLVKLGEWCGELASNYKPFIRTKENGRMLQRITEEERARLLKKTGSNSSNDSFPEV
jgi:glycosyltransferase involved in cell wall biosynthesis